MADAELPLEFVRIKRALGSLLVRDKSSNPILRDFEWVVLEYERLWWKLHEKQSEERRDDRS